MSESGRAECAGGQAVACVGADGSSSKDVFVVRHVLCIVLLCHQHLLFFPLQDLL